MNTHASLLKQKLTDELLDGLCDEEIELLIEKYKVEENNFIKNLFKTIIIILVVSFIFFITFAPFINFGSDSEIKFIGLGILIILIVVCIRSKILADLKRIQESPHAKHNLLFLQDKLMKMVNENIDKKKRIKEALKETNEINKVILEKYNLKECDIKEYYED